MFRIIALSSLLCVLSGLSLTLTPNREAGLDQQKLGYNRYQAIYFCKQHRWEFCRSWGELGITRLA